MAMNGLDKLPPTDPYRRTDMVTITLVSALVVLLVGWLIWRAVEGKKKWEEFAAAHDCKVVEKVKGDVTVGTGVVVATSGQVGTVTTTNVERDKTAYRCNDGVTYWR